MPDRRQGDRRDSSGIQNKKLSISLGTLISIIIIVLLVIVSIVLCRISYSKGYDTGYSDGFSEAITNLDYINETDEYDYLFE